MFSNAHLPLIIAHRGASAHAPENTLAAFKKAIAMSADGLEFDVRLTRDGVPIVFHDSNLKRLAGQNLLISEINSVELTDIDVGSWFNRKNPHRRDEAFSRERVPTLAQFVDFLGTYSGQLYLELKCDGDERAALVETVSEIVSRSKLLSQIIVKSFDLEAVSLAGDKMPGVRRAALFEPKLSTFFAAPRRLIDLAKGARAEELSLHYSMAKPKLIAEAARFGLTTIVWTSDRPVWVERAARIGVKAIITNDPASLLARKKEIALQNQKKGR